MATIRTADRNRVFFLKVADYYELEAEKARTEAKKQEWQARAAEARQHAATYPA